MMDSLESLFSLRGHVALVTGASSGLGIECARALAIAGADIALTARRRERLEALADELRAQNVRALPIAADITVDSELDRIVSSTIAELGEIDILVNNAGLAAGGGGLAITRDAWEAEFTVNVTAPMMLCQKVARRLIERKSPGRIINMTSIYAGLGNPYRMVAYAASKSALVNLTRELAVEWAGYGINVNALSPGMIPTELNEKGLAMPGIRERTESFTPLVRLGRPDEIRTAVIYLASAASSYVTGSVLCVDGGYQAW
jgi:NAD(P)-dependent dehydrogenase (short-subunit alcohol dehydrogenase family)